MVDPFLGKVADKTTSLSTSEAEFVAASLAGQEAICLRETLTDFGFSQTTATLLYEDNLASRQPPSDLMEVWSNWLVLKD